MEIYANHGDGRLDSRSNGDLQGGASASASEGTHVYISIIARFYRYTIWLLCASPYRGVMARRLAVADFVFAKKP